MSPIEETRPRRLSGSKRDAEDDQISSPRATAAAVSTPRKGSALSAVFDRNTSFAVKKKTKEATKEAPASPRFSSVVSKATSVNTAAMALATQGLNTTSNKVMQMAASDKVQGHTVHSFAEDECTAFADFINRHMSDVPELAYLLPIESPEQLFEAVTDGALLSRLINVAAPDTIDERVINLQPRNPFHVTENHNLMISAAKSIGLKVINIGAEDLSEGRPHLVLGLLWQMVKMALLARINLHDNPFLFRLLQDGETLQDLLKLPPEQILLRWINFHLKEAGSAKRVHNFGPDLADSEAYAVLLKQIDPDGKCATSILRETTDRTKRAEYVVTEGSRLQQEFRIRPRDIVSANDKLNLGFCAALFNACPGLEPPPEPLELPDDENESDSREERAFRMWINSLGIERHVADLFEDVCDDGLALLQLMDAVNPGIVPWERVNKLPKGMFQRLENLNMAVARATMWPPNGFGFSLVGVQGKDLYDKNRKLTLALIWQLRRYNLLQVLNSLRAKTGSAKKLTDDAILRWANETVAAAGSARKARSFGDEALGDGLLLADLLAAVRPGCLDPAMMAAGATDDERKANAKYVLSVARKLGCTLFLLWEDIVEAKPKMMFSFVATLMCLALEEPEQEPGRRASVCE